MLAGRRTGFCDDKEIFREKRPRGHFGRGPDGLPVLPFARAPCVWRMRRQRAHGILPAR